MYPANVAPSRKKITGCRLAEKTDGPTIVIRCVATKNDKHLKRFIFRNAKGVKPLLVFIVIVGGRDMRAFEL